MVVVRRVRMHPNHTRMRNERSLRVPAPRERRLHANEGKTALDIYLFRMKVTEQHMHQTAAVTRASFLRCIYLLVENRVQSTK